jgi:hypothetical protein
LSIRLSAMDALYKIAVYSWQRPSAL